MTVTRLVPPPGPRGLEVAGFFGGGSFAKTLAYFEQVARRYGPIASFSAFGRRLHLVTGPELVHEVLVLGQHRYARANGAAILRDLLGESMLMVDEPRHRERRRLLQPAFHARRIAGYGSAMLEETQRAMVGWQDGDCIDMSAAMTKLALTIVGRALFGADVRGSSDALDASLGQAMRVVSWLGPILETLPPWANRLRLSLPLPANAHLARARREMATIIERLVALRNAQNGAGDDLLSMLLAARDVDDKPLDAQSVADELVTLMLAGHETTANTLAWAWYLLARHPHIEARLVEEVVAAAGERPIAIADLPRLPFAAQIFREVLRLYPPASAFGRRALDAGVLGGFAVGSGDGILLSPYVSHRNPAVFPDPATFDPDRWSPDAATPPRCAYFPFGGGSRLCIGEAFARIEGTLVLAAITQRFALQTVNADPIPIAAHATLRPARPIVLRLRRR